MIKIKCTQCGEELKSKTVHDFVYCKCVNQAFTNGDDMYQRIGAKDLHKIKIWCVLTNKFERVVM